MNVLKYLKVSQKERRAEYSFQKINLEIALLSDYQSF